MTTRTQAEVVVDSLIEAVCANICADPSVAAGFKHESGGVEGHAGMPVKQPVGGADTGSASAASAGIESRPLSPLRSYRVDLDLGGQIDWMDVRAANPEEAMWEALELVDEYTRKSAAFITVSVGER